MQFEIGDEVKHLRQDLSGNVTGFASNGDVLVDIQGFDMSYPPGELVHARPKAAGNGQPSPSATPASAKPEPPERPLSQTTEQTDAKTPAPKAASMPDEKPAISPVVEHPLSVPLNQLATASNEPEKADEAAPEPKKLSYVSSGLKAQADLDSGFYLTLSGEDSPYELRLLSLVSTPHYVALYEADRLEAHGHLKTGQSLHLKSMSKLLGKRAYYLHAMPLHENLQDARQLHYTLELSPEDFERETIDYGQPPQPTRFCLMTPGRPEPSFKSRGKSKGGGKRKIRRVQPKFLKEARAFNLEVDLHLEALLKPGERVASKEALEYQLTAASKAMEEALEAGVQNLTFIHGIGAGKLKEALIDHLRVKHGENVKQMYLGGRYSDNPGALYVELTYDIG